VGVVTGGGASFLGEAARLGLHALVTGEGPHHTYIDAMELGVHVLLGGHYATETFGVKALAQLVSERFGVDWFFVDQPTGL
jgi:putative NIF3 family GTP cyclohydrolase 1 type 2